MLFRTGRIELFSRCRFFLRKHIMSSVLDNPAI